MDIKNKHPGPEYSTAKYPCCGNNAGHREKYQTQIHPYVPGDRGQAQIQFTRGNHHILEQRRAGHALAQP